MKRIVFSDQAKTDIRAIPQPTAMQILTAIHRLAETGAGRVKTLQGQGGEKRLRVGTSGSASLWKAVKRTRARSISTFHNRKDAYR